MHFKIKGKVLNCGTKENIIEPENPVSQKIKWISLWMVVFNLFGWIFLDFKDSLGVQLAIFTPIWLLAFAAIYFFYKGKNWARILVLIGSALCLINFLLLFAESNPWKMIYLISEGIFGIYLLWILNRQEVKAYFVSSPEKKKRGWVVFWIVIGAIGFILAALAAWGVMYFTKRVGNTQIWMESLEGDDQWQIPVKNKNDFPRFSNDGLKVAYVSESLMPPDEGAAVVIYSIPDKTSKILFEDKGFLMEPVWTPDDKALLYLKKDSQTDIWAYDFESASSRRLTNDAAIESQLDLSPDGQWLIFLQQDGDGEKAVFLMPAGGGPKKRLTEKTNFLHEPESPAWSPNGKQIVYLSFVDLILQDVETGAKQSHSLAGLNNIYDLQFFPGNPDAVFLKARLADSASFDSNLYSVSLASKEIKVLKSKRGLMELFYDLSPDGKTMVYSKA